MRLTEISVSEISLVDKAANKKKYAFFKREGEDGKKDDVAPAVPDPAAGAKIAASDNQVDKDPCEAGKKEDQKPEEEFDAEDVKLFSEITEVCNEITARL